MDTAERNRLVVENMGLANHIVRTLWNMGRLRSIGTFEDCLQESFIALGEAVSGFEATHEKANWPAYLSKCIRRHLETLSKTSGVIRVAAWTQRKATRENRPEVSEHANRVRNVCDIGGRHDENSDRPRNNTYEPSYTPDHSEPMVVEEMIALVRKLPAETRDAIEMRFGLNGGDHCTLREIAEKYSVSHEAARQRLVFALRKLRQELEGDSHEPVVIIEAKDDSPVPSQEAQDLYLNYFSSVQSS